MRLRFWKRKEGRLIDLTTLQLKPDCRYVLFYDRQMIRRDELDEALEALLGQDDIARVRVVGTRGNPKDVMCQLEVL